MEAIYLSGRSRGVAIANAKGRTRRFISLKSDGFRWIIRRVPSNALYFFEKAFRRRIRVRVGVLVRE